MELKIARKELSDKPKTVEIEKIVEDVKKIGQRILYFDRENSHKTMIEFVEYFERLGYSVYFRDIKYGLDEDNYMYEVHIL
jgi:hypothetical protein